LIKYEIKQKIAFQCIISSQLGAWQAYRVAVNN